MTETGGGARLPRKAPVMADVAKLAGVSHQTVSRVVNGSDHVKDDTIKRVLDAMQKLDYRPNPVARALATGKSKTLGVGDTTRFVSANAGYDEDVTVRFPPDGGPA